MSDELLAYTKRRDRVLVAVIAVVLIAAVAAFIVMTMRDRALAERCLREEYAAAWSRQEMPEECE